VRVIALEVLTVGEMVSVGEREGHDAVGGAESHTVAVGLPVAQGHGLALNEEVGHEDMELVWVIERVVGVVGVSVRDV